MTPISRRNLLVLGGLGGAGVMLRAGAATAATRAAVRSHDAPAGTWVGAGDLEHVYDASVPGAPKYLNDHTVIRAQDGSWHLFGIIGDAAPPGRFPDGAKEIHFAHATAPALHGPWTTLPDALTVDPDYFGEVHLWAPHVVYHDGTYHMFYAAGGVDDSAINLATSTDLTTWTRVPTGPLFRGLVARDPYVVRIGEQWVMYYCELADWHSHHIVACRTSTDLRNWSAPRTVFTDAATDDVSASVTESPFVLQRGDSWYLFIGPRNGYVGTDVFVSTDPFAFAPGEDAGHVPTHAAEVVDDGDDWWVTGAGSFEHGIYLAPLRWRSTPPVWQGPANPAVALDATGTLTLFALSRNDSSMIVRQQTDAGWTDWAPFGPAADAVPALGRNADGRLEAFAVVAGTLRHRRQRADGSWLGWVDLGIPAGSVPALDQHADGRLAAFLLDPAGTGISTLSQTTPGGDWGAANTFGGPAGAPPVVAANADGRLEVVALGPDAAYLAHRWQNAPNGDWSDWDATLGPTPAGSAPSIARGVDGRLTVFALAPVGVGVNARTQTTPSGGWGDWGGFGSWSDASPTVAASADGRLEAFLMPPGGAILTHRWQNGDGSWSAAEQFGTGDFAGAPGLGSDVAGRLHLFVVTPNGVVRSRAQLAPSSGWGDWQTLPGPAVAVRPTNSPT